MSMEVQAQAAELEQEAASGSATKTIEGRTPWQLARQRLMRDKITLTMLGIVIFFLFLAVFAPLMERFGIIHANDGATSVLNSDGMPKGAWGGISASHWLGVEPGTGRDLLSRIVLGTTGSFVIALFATIIAITIGMVVGLISGFRGGRTDFWLSRLMDMVLSFPQTLMLLALSGTMTALLIQIGVPAGDLANGLYVILILGIFGWAGFARIVRGQVLSLREREFIEAAKSIGAKNSRIYFKELLPNLWAPVLVYFTLYLPAYISAEAALSFLGVGIKAPTPTLGNILTDSVQYSQSDPVFFFAPGLTICLLVVALNLLGDGLRDALDPKAGR